MNALAQTSITATTYDRTACDIGVVHLGFGAFHRSHQSVYFDDYMNKTGDLRWGIAAVNLRATEASHFSDAEADVKRHDGYYLKSYVYGFLRAALIARVATTAAPLTIACCDNIRQNGKMLHRNLLAYLTACEDHALVEWVTQNVAFPCSMVDRITPRSPAELGIELTALVGQKVTSPVMAEDFVQWVLQDAAAAEMPDLSKVGVTVTSDVDPYEETKIRVLNGGHTALSYLAALEGIETFDAAMRVPHLKAHFQDFETKEVLPAITLDLPFSKQDYLLEIEQRFSNQAIGDTIARISADGMAKFPIFIRPTLEGCFAQGIEPVHAIRSIASWHHFARYVAAGKIPFEYVEPIWDQLSDMLGKDSFVTSRQLWGDIPENYPEFAALLQREINKMEATWPI